METKWREIVRILYNYDEYIDREKLAKDVNISIKYLESILEYYSKTTNYNDFEVRENGNRQIKLIVNDSQKFQKFILEGNYITTESEMRISILLKYILDSNDYLKIEDIADMMFISRATVDRLMPSIKEILEKYELVISTKPKYGIKVEGTEINKRLCIAHEISKPTSFSNEEVVRQVQNILLEVINKFNLMLNDINLYNLVQHCVIAITRIKSKNIMLDEEDYSFGEDATSEIRASEEIIKKFEMMFQISIPISEQKYIIMHLLGKKMQIEQTLTEQTLETVHEIFAYILLQEGIDFNDDQFLKTTLALHIQPMMTRLKYGLKQENPNLTEIKREMLKGYDFALHAAKVIEKLYALKVSEDEIAYLALHFALALDKRKEHLFEKKIVVVCSSGRGTARILQHRLVERYRFKQDNLIIMSSFALDNFDFSDILCVLTTIPLKLDVDIPVILIDMLLNDSSTLKVDNFIKSLTLLSALSELTNEVLFFDKIQLKDRESIIRYMTARSAELYRINKENFFEQVMLREESSSTEVGNMVALPHPYIYDGDTIILSFLSLAMPIKWKYGLVKLVILMALPNRESPTIREVSDLITDFVSSEESVKKLIENTSKETFIKIVKGGH